MIKPVGADALGCQRVAQLGPTGLDERAGRGVLGVDVELDAAAGE